MVGLLARLLLVSLLPPTGGEADLPAGTWECRDDEARITLHLRPGRLLWIVRPPGHGTTVIDAGGTPGPDDVVSGTITRVRHASDCGYNLDQQLAVPFRARLILHGDTLTIDRFEADEGFDRLILRGTYHRANPATE